MSISQNVHQTAKRGVRATGFILQCEMGRHITKKCRRFRCSLPQEVSDALAAILSQLRHSDAHLKRARLVLQPIPESVLKRVWRGVAMQLMPSRVIDDGFVNTTLSFVQAFLKEHRFPFEDTVESEYAAFLDQFDLTPTSLLSSIWLQLCHATTLSYSVASGQLEFTCESASLVPLLKSHWSLDLRPHSGWALVQEKESFTHNGESFAATWTLRKAGRPDELRLPTTYSQTSPMSLRLRPIWPAPSDRDLTFFHIVHRGCVDDLPKDIERLNQLANTKRTRQGYSALHVAAQGFHFKMLRHLLNACRGTLNVNDAGSRTGLTPLMLAIRYIPSSMQRPDGTALRASFQRVLDTITLLLQHGADPCLTLYPERLRVESSWIANIKLLELSALGMAVNKLQDLARKARATRSTEYVETSGMLHNILELLIAFAPRTLTFCSEPKDPLVDAAQRTSYMMWRRIGATVAVDARNKAIDRTSTHPGSQCTVWHWLLRRALALEGDDELMLMDTPTHYFDVKGRLCSEADLNRADGQRNLPPHVFPNSLLPLPSTDNCRLDPIRRGGLPLFEYLLLLPSCGKQAFTDALRDVLWSGAYQQRILYAGCHGREKRAALMFPPDLTFSFANRFHNEENMPKVNWGDVDDTWSVRPAEEDHVRHLDRQWVWNYTWGATRTRTNERMIPIASRLGIITHEQCRNDGHLSVAPCVQFLMQRPGAFLDFVL